MDEQDLDFATIATNLSPAEKAEYLALLRMFESDGWKVLQQQVAHVREGAQQTFNHAPSWDVNRYYRGYIDSIDAVIQYEDTAERLYSRIAREHLAAVAPAEIEVEDRSME